MIEFLESYILTSIFFSGFFLFLIYKILSLPFVRHPLFLLTLGFFLIIGSIALKVYILATVESHKVLFEPFTMILMFFGTAFISVALGQRINRSIKEWKETLLRRLEFKRKKLATIDPQKNIEQALELENEIKDIEKEIKKTRLL